jgi:hypothetical protein
MMKNKGFGEKGLMEIRFMDGEMNRGVGVIRGIRVAHPAAWGAK